MKHVSLFAEGVLIMSSGPTLQEIEAGLLRDGSMFELVETQTPRGPVRVFKNRPPTMRALLQHAASYGDRTYLLFTDGERERRWSFAEHDSDVKKIAHILQTQFGVTKGDRVAIAAANCPEWLLTFWATLRLGAIAVGINAWGEGDELRFAIDDCDPKLVVADKKRLDRIGRNSMSVPSVEIESEFDAMFLGNAALPDENGVDQNNIDESDPAVILYTSGTTGRPKGVVHTHGNLANLVMTSFFHGMRLMLFAAGGKAPEGEPPASTILVTSPLFHVSGLHCAAVVGLAAGAKTVWPMGRFDPELVCELIETHGVSGWGFTSTMLHRLVRHPRAKETDFSSMKSIGGGGSAIPSALQDEALALIPQCRPTMGVGYGLTEACAFTTLNPGPELRAFPNGVGRAIPIVDIEIRDENGERVENEVEGDIYVRGPLVMQGYWRNIEATRASIDENGWLKTGDLGSLRDGRLFLASRRTDLIIRGGENIYPAEIEARLSAHPGVEECVVVGIENEEYGQEVKAIVVPHTDRSPAIDELRSWVAQALAQHKVPAHWEMRATALPRTATGKIVRHALYDGATPWIEE
ncbi:MAG: class I adenylate-forming enzyme family protein [Polyangiales bacterium]